MKHYTERQIEIMEAATDRIYRFGIQNLTIKTLASDVGLSEPALYRHFKSKNNILLELLNYYMLVLKDRTESAYVKQNETAANQLRSVFNSQLKVFANKPAIVSVIFAESIFHFDETLSKKVSEIMEMMYNAINLNIKKGQETGQYITSVDTSVLATIITGGMRMAVQKWKLAGHKTNLVKKGNEVLEGILKLIENKN